jgi:hypothetical protein
MQRSSTARGFLFTAFAMLAIWSVAAGQTQVNIGARKDNTLYESATGALSNGAGPHFFAGKTNASASIRRGLIAFDVTSAVPAGSTILSVTLTLNVDQTISGAQNVSLLRALADWGEGSSAALLNEGGGAPSSIGDATWVHRFFNSSVWSTQGGEFLSTPSATQSVAGIGTYTWGSTAQMVSDVQNWLTTPSNNFGWVIVGREDTVQTAKRFGTRENADSTMRPKLTITYRSALAVLENQSVPQSFLLHQNYPNPFNPTTTIEYDLPTLGEVSIRVFNVIGNEVAVLVNTVQNPGRKAISFDASGLATGVYFYRLQAGEFTQTRRLTLVK